MQSSPCRRACLCCLACVAGRSNCCRAGPLEQRPLPWLQTIKRDSLNADNQSAFWHDRYTLRPAYDSLTGQALVQQPAGAAAGVAGMPPTPAGMAAGPARPLQPLHDVPVFLLRQKQLILNTGKYLNVMRECKAAPPRTLPLGAHLGRWPEPFRVAVPGIQHGDRAVCGRPCQVGMVWA